MARDYLSRLGEVDWSQLTGYTPATQPNYEMPNLGPMGAAMNRGRGGKSYLQGDVQPELPPVYAPFTLDEANAERAAMARPPDVYSGVSPQNIPAGPAPPPKVEPAKQASYEESVKSSGLATDPGVRTNNMTAGGDSSNPSKPVTNQYLNAGQTREFNRKYPDPYADRMAAPGMAATFEGITAGGRPS